MPNRAIRNLDVFTVYPLFSVFLGMVMTIGCAGSQESVKPIAREPVGKPPAQSSEDVPLDRRLLSTDARFGDLIAAVNHLDQHDQHHSEKKCLLRRLPFNSERIALEADLAVAVRPLPDAPERLDKRLRTESGKIHVITIWDRIGVDASGIALVAFTTTSPASARLPAVALFLTDRGITIRQTDQIPEPNNKPIQLNQLASFLADIASQKNFALYVTADAQIPLSALYDLLSTLPYPQPEVALAVALAAGTRLPTQSKPSTRDTAVWCPQGLPELKHDAPQGDIPRSDIVATVGAMREEAQQCLAAADGSAAGGGRVQVAIRVGASGSVERQCLIEDEIQNLALAKCILSTVSSLRFPPPNPSGSVDIHLPLRLTSQGISGQKPVCE
jgi:hypothetical protein